MSTTLLTEVAGLPPGARAWSTPDVRERRGSASWGDGPWVDEPDKVSWTDAATGRPCLIVRGPAGALCGYVAVDPGHPWHGVGYGQCGQIGGPCDEDYCGHSIDGALEVHGGLTYASLCAETDDEGHGICHVPEPGRPADVWWFGFDCAHAFDLVPGMASTGHGPIPGDVYRTVDYVARECQRLAEQFVAVTS